MRFFFFNKNTNIVNILFLLLFMGCSGGGDENSDPVQDTIAPIIILNGENPMDVKQGQYYQEPDATATDNVDGVVVVVITGSVNTNVVGDYSITYTATDNANNTSQSIRDVRIIASQDQVPPVITINGDSQVTITQGSGYVDAGAVAVDDRDGSVEVETNNNVNSDLVGNYTVIYTAVDAAGNNSSATRTVDVVSVMAVAKPFPQQMDYDKLSKPSHKSQAQLNQAVLTHFNDWKNAYLTESNGTTPGGGYYIKMDGDDCSPNTTTSEAHGYGMIVMALMAGEEVNAKLYFDGMFNVYHQHRSIINQHLMSWCIHPSEERQYDSDAATDGDMDIAYGLLLAHEQWGSNGLIDYLAEAKRIINNGIKVSEMGDDKRILLGDWVTKGSNYEFGSRSSDWMTSHLRVFANATSEHYWNEAADKVYEIMDVIRDNYSQTTGLMPDFINGKIPQPAVENYLEASTDGSFSWNACRMPLRIAFDVAHFDNDKAREAVSYIVDWIQLKTQGDPSLIVAGYDLQGNALVSYSDMAFTAPMVAAATVANGEHQEFINKGWDLMNSSVDNDPNNYYSNSLKLLSMLFVSGNWWQPLQ